MAMAAAMTAPVSRGSPVLPRLKKLDSMMAYLEEAKGATRDTKSWISGGSAATWSGGFTSDSGGESATSSTSSDDESSATSALRPRHSWVSPRLVISMEEAAAQVRAKGSLLARIGSLEAHVVKLKAEMKVRKLESKEDNTASFVGDVKEATTKMVKGRVKDQRQPDLPAKLRQLLPAGRRRIASVPKERPQVEVKGSKDSKPRGFLSKLLHPGSLFAPAKGCFLPSSSSIKTVEKGEHNRTTSRKDESKRVKGGLEAGLRKSRFEELEASHRPGKQKGLREVEVQRLLSLQGIQSFSTQYPQQPF